MTSSQRVHKGKNYTKNNQSVSGSILTQKRKTRTICHFNPLFRVCHICHFGLPLLIYIEMWSGGGSVLEKFKVRVILESWWFFTLSLQQLHYTLILFFSSLFLLLSNIKNQKLYGFLKFKNTLIESLKKLFGLIKVAVHLNFFLTYSLPSPEM